MSLRTDFTGALDTKLEEARLAGNDFIAVTSLATLTAQMASAAASGLSTFTVNLTPTYQPTDLRLGGNLWSAYQSGVLGALAAEGIMGNEVTATLDTTDAVTLVMDLTFTF
jgi:hypothetical protein